VKSLNPSSSGTGNLALETVHGEKDKRKCDSKKKIEKHSACIVRSVKDRREENVIQRKNLSNLVPVLCASKKWLWNAGG
jgi:hypothetical protein